MGKKDNVESVEIIPKNATKIVTVGIIGITSHAATRDNAQLIMQNVHRDRDATKIVTVVDITGAA